MLRGPSLDSETGWTGELWSKVYLLKWKNQERQGGEAGGFGVTFIYLKF